jgi:hypothetical protein
LRLLIHFSLVVEPWIRIQNRKFSVAEIDRNPVLAPAGEKGKGKPSQFEKEVSHLRPLSHNTLYWKLKES